MTTIDQIAQLIMLLAVCVMFYFAYKLWNKK